MERLGYRYEHCFRADGDLIRNNEIIDGYEPCLEKKVYLFQIKTNFKLKIHRELRSEINRPMGSEIHRMCMYESDGEMYLKDWMSCRLDAYWMPEERIEYLVSQAFDFAKECSVADDARLVIPVALDLVIWTLQLATEPVGETFARAIKPEFSDLNLPKIREFSKLNLPKIRVEVEEDVDRWSILMKTCPICQYKTTVGAQISVLPCGHAFHYYCIAVEWLFSNNSCPTCRVPVRTDLPYLC